MKKLSEIETMQINGGTTWKCRICGYTSTSYWKVYLNALQCCLLAGFDFVFPPTTVN